MFFAYISTTTIVCNEKFLVQRHALGLLAELTLHIHKFSVRVAVRRWLLKVRLFDAFILLKAFIKLTHFVFHFLNDLFVWFITFILGLERLIARLLLASFADEPLGQI
jgi:hypothetical protein